MKVFCAATAFALVSTAVATASTVQVPLSGKPVATFTIPDDWRVKSGEEGTEATPADDGVSIHLDVGTKVMTPEEILKEANGDAKKEAGADGKPEEPMTLDSRSVKSSTDDINGMKATVSKFDVGMKGEDGKIPFTAIQVATSKPDVIVVIAYVGTPQGKKDHQAEIDAIIKSLTFVR